MSSVLDIQYREATLADLHISVYWNLGVWNWRKYKSNAFPYRSVYATAAIKFAEQSGNKAAISLLPQTSRDCSVGRSAKKMPWSFTTISATRFLTVPQSSQLTSSVYSPYLTANIGLDVFFGQEKDIRRV